MAMPSDSRLPLDIWMLIMETLDRPSLKALAEVSKDMYTLSMPALYSKIDLSIHHTVPQILLQGGSAITQWPIDVQKIFGQQSLLMQQMLDHPELALRVYSFTWTMGLHHLCDLPRWAQTSTALKHDDIYTLFQSLCNVTDVDIGGGDIHDYPCPPIQNLFPKATHIHLSGQMHYSLASSILHGPDKAPLENLVLDNLLERGRLETGDNFQPQYNPNYKHISRLLPLEEIWPEDAPPVQVSPGEMTRLLGPALQFRCRHLRRFVFGLLDLTSESRSKILPPGWSVRTAVIHEELTSFLRKVHPREIDLIYSRPSPQRREDLKYHFARRSCLKPPLPPVAPQHNLLETLLEGWPGLGRLTLRGGRHAQDEQFPSPAGRTTLENVQVHWEADEWEYYQGQLCTKTPDHLV